MSLPTCANCGKLMICRVLTKTVGGNKVPMRRNKKTGRSEPTCWFPCKCKYRSKSGIYVD